MRGAKPSRDTIADWSFSPIPPLTEASLCLQRLARRPRKRGSAPQWIHPRFVCVLFVSIRAPIRVHSRLPFAVLFAPFRGYQGSPPFTSHLSPLTREAPPAGVSRAPRNTIWITDNPNASTSTRVDNADAYPVSPITNPCLKM